MPCLSSWELSFLFDRLCMHHIQLYTLVESLFKILCLRTHITKWKVLADSARTIILPCWIWPGYPAINQEYKTIVKIVFFAQILVKSWSWVLKQRGWLEMTFIYLTSVWFGGLFKDPGSRNNENLQAKITEPPNLVVVNGSLAKNFILDLLFFFALQVCQDHDLQRNQSVEVISHFIAEKSSMF